MEKLPIPEYASEEFSASDSEDDSDEDEDDDTPDEQTATELGQHVLTVSEILADLYKLSFKIRNSATRPKSTRPTLYKEVDEETQIDKFETFAGFDRKHVEESFKQLRMETAASQKIIAPSKSSEEQESGVFLIDRLAETITKRRRMLRYWQRHSEKLSDTPEVVNEVVLEEKMLEIRGANEGQLLELPKSVGKMPAPSFKQQTIFSGTEASKYDPKFDGMLDAQSVITYMSEAFDLEGNIVALPPPPIEASTATEFLCPYCGIICPSRHAEDLAWRYVFSFGMH